MKEATLVLVRNGNTLLLGVKASKVCKGHLVPPGGKLEDGEDLRACAIRETATETGVTPILSKKPIATVVCRNLADDSTYRIAVYMTSSYTGAPRDSKEFSSVGWYAINAATACRMMEGDLLWLPFAMRGDRFEAEIVYDTEWRVFSSSFRMREAPSD